MNKQLLHISALIYSHLQGAQIYTKRHTQRGNTTLSNYKW